MDQDLLENTHEYPNISLQTLNHEFTRFKNYPGAYLKKFSDP